MLLDEREVLLRSLRKSDISPTHGGIKAASLKPPKRSNGRLSLIRERIGFKRAESSAVDKVHGSHFEGFGRVRLSELQPQVADVVDARYLFHGHADAIYDFVIPVGPPDTPSAMVADYKEAMDRLAKIARLFEVVTQVD